MDNANPDRTKEDPRQLDANQRALDQRQKEIDRLLRDEPWHYAGLYDQQRSRRHD